MALVECPRCRFNLEGLPEEHVCPECGTSYDPHMVIVRLQPWLRDLRNVHYGLLLITAAVLVPMGTGRIAGDTYFIAFLVVLTIGASIRMMRRRHLDLQLVVSSRGVQLEPKHAIPFDWSVVEGAGYNQWTGQFRLRGTDGSELLRLSARTFGTRALADKSTRIVNRLAKHYKAVG